MNLIETLRRMAADAETGRWAAREPSTDVEDREATETVRAMQEALRLWQYAEETTGLSNGAIRKASEATAEALRRAEGNAG